MDMKNLFGIFAAVLLCLGCSQASEEVRLDVSVDNPVSDEVVVVCHNDITTFPLDEAGKASVVLDVDDVAYFKLFHGRASLLMYVEKGDKASLTFDGGDITGSYVFEGDKAQAVRYLNTVSLVALPDDSYALPFEEFRSRLAEKEMDAVRLLEAGGLSSAGDFEEMEKNRIRYAYAAPLMMYPMAHVMMTADKDYRPGKDYYDVIESYVKEDPRLACLDEYRAFVAEAMHVLDPSGNEVTAIYPKTVAQMKYAAGYFRSPEVKEIIIHHIASAYVDNFGVKDITEMNNIYHTYVKTPALSASYAVKQERWDLSRPGKMSPGFVASDVDGGEHRLAEFRGRYVYVDVWATWCGPCRKEAPYLKALEEEFKDAEIVFLGLSVDRDRKAWETMVRNGDLGGIQLYLGPGSRFQEAYRIEGIPRFILLDKDGRIISNDMSRPSSPKTAETLRNLEGIR